MRLRKLEKGFIQIYTGNGKGKTTAAIGLAVRAAGFGIKTFIFQFMKEYPYSEIVSLKALCEWITIEQYCGDDFVYKKEKPPRSEIEKAGDALKKVWKVLSEDEFEIIILDEICVAIYFGLVSSEDVVELLKAKPEEKEIILTGRYCPEELIELADLVTEMKEIKHYYTQGVLSRKGIDS